MPTANIEEVLIHTGDWLKITHPSIEDGGDGQVVYVRIKETNEGISTNPDNTSTSHYSDTIGLDIFNSLSTRRTLNWHNCYSFGNGVESNRIADNFNTPQITPGVKVSTIFEDYKEEHRKYGLIYSGLYNSTSGVNNLNQFIQAEKITKDINPTYGSIQKLHTRNTDLVTLCEDKVLRILANKDALYNADGNLQLTATENVLGQTVPFVGEFGISKNPESFVSEAYRSYFTDKQRGAVMRLSKDGLTPISMHGMKDWFRDNLSTSKVNLLGEDILSSNDNWDIPVNGNSYVANGVATIGYYNSDVFNDRYGRSAYLEKEDILEIGKKYRLQYDVVSHGGLTHEDFGSNQKIFIANHPPGSSIHVPGPLTPQSAVVGAHVNVAWIANRTSLILQQYQVNQSGGGYYDGTPNSQTTTIEEWVGAQRGETAGSYTWHGGNHLYGGIVTIANMVLEEVKIEPKIIGSYDDRQDEYNVTIRSANPTTVSFREDVTGWVSFKSFLPENAVSCANDYYTIKDGKLWQHHIQGIKRNTFYNTTTNSSVNVILNDFPGSVKSFNTLDYEGSDSRVEGVRTVEITGIDHATAGDNGRYFFYEKEDMSSVINEDDFAQWHGTFVDMKQYRNNIPIRSGLVKLFNDPSLNSGIASPSGGPTKGHGRYDPYSSSNPGDFQVGDIITTEEQEKIVNHFNSIPKDGWYVSNFITNKQEGSLPEFIEKEGKWFNYIKGIDSGVDSTTDFGAFDIQGVGIIESMSGSEITFANNINSSLQVGDTLYSETPSEVLGDNILDVNEVSSMTDDTSGISNLLPNGLVGFDNDGFTIVNDTTITWLPTANTPSGINYFNNLTTENIVIGERYYATLEISNYGGAGDLGLSTSGGLSFNMRLDRDGVVNEYFIATTDSKPDFFTRPTNSGTIKATIQKVIPGNIFGFTKLESSNIKEVGVVTDLTNNIVTVGAIINSPSSQDYIMFTKNHAVNTSSLLGYYADVKFENNSINKVELFSVGSEITESSK